MFFINKSRNILLFSILVLLINFLFVNKAYAYNVKPGELEVTEIMSTLSVRWIEIVNKTKTQIDISGYSITTGENFYLYPKQGNNPFIIPKDYILILTNDISKLQEQITKNMPVVMIEIPDLSINPLAGSVIIKDQIGVELDKVSYKQDMNIFADGYSLERVSTSLVSDDKLFPSIELGGTPGRIFNKETTKEGYEVDPNKPLSMTSCSVDMIDSSNVNIYWTTSKKATSIIEYGTNPNDLAKLETDDQLTFFHVIKLHNLDDKTTYYYRTISRVDNQEIKSDIIQQFQTGLSSSLYRPSLTQDLSSVYDFFDTKFLNIVVPTKDISKKEFIKDNKNNIKNSANATNSEFSNFTSLTGYSIAAVLASIFIIFVIVKFYLRNRKQYNFDFH